MKYVTKSLYNISNEQQSFELIIIEHNNTGARLLEQECFQTFGFYRKRNSQKFSACVSDYKRPPGKIVLIMPTKLAHRLAPRLGNTSFMGFLGEQIKQIGSIKISCWQRSVKEIRFDYTKKEISYAPENDNYVKSKVIRSE